MQKNHGTKRHRNIVFTSYSLADDGWEVVLRDLWNNSNNQQGGPISYLVYQLERCPNTGRLHIQGYAEFNAQLRLGAIQRLFGDQKMHVEPRRGTAQQARDYCLKEESRVSPGGEHGRISTPGTSSAGRDLAQAIRNRPEEFQQLALAHPWEYVRNCNGLEKLATMATKPTNRGPIEIHLLIGKTGIGKTAYAFNHWPELWSYDYEAKRFWNGYQGQETVLFDEFDGQLPITSILKWCDRYPLRINTKGGSQPLRAKRFIFASNIDMGIWWLDAKEEQRAAWNRRITEFGITHEADDIEQDLFDNILQNHKEDEQPINSD